MSDVRVIRQAPCPAGCEGGFAVSEWWVRDHNGIKIRRARGRTGAFCPTCEGKGTVDEAVTCGSCRWWAHDGECLRMNECGGRIVRESFACAAWEARDDR